MAVADPNQSPVNPGLARPGSGPYPHVSAGERAATSWSSSSIQPRNRQAGALFQPVITSEPPAAAIAEQPVPPSNEPPGGSEPRPVPAQPTGYVPGTRRWVRRGTGLLVGTPGAVIAFVASAVLVLGVAGVTVFTTSSPSPESPSAEPAAGRLPVPATPAISDGHLATEAPLDAPAEPARPATATAYSSKPAAVKADQQPSPTVHRALPAAQIAPPAPDHGPALPPPAPPQPTMGTTSDAEYWTVTTGSHTEDPESRSTDVEPCRCNTTMHTMPGRVYQPSNADRERELRARQVEYRQESRGYQRSNQDRQEVGQAPNAEHRPSRSVARPGR